MAINLCELDRNRGGRRVGRRRALEEILSDHERTMGRFESERPFHPSSMACETILKKIIFVPYLYAIACSSSPHAAEDNVGIVRRCSSRFSSSGLYTGVSDD